MRWATTKILKANEGGYIVITEFIVGEPPEDIEPKHKLYWCGWYKEVKEYAFSTWKEVKEYLDKLGEKQDEIQKTK